MQSVAASTTRAWSVPAGLGAAAAAGCVAVALLDPGDNGVPLCVFRALTGHDCPGCGATRAVANLLRGRVDAASDYNLLLVVSLPVLAYVYLCWLAGSFGVRLPTARPGRVGTAVLATAVVGFAILRNLPVGVGRYLNSDPALR